jgi:hypothetical protein
MTNEPRSTNGGISYGLLAIAYATSRSGQAQVSRLTLMQAN